MGNYTMEYRIQLFRELLTIQKDTQQFRSSIDLITSQELIAIQVMWFRDGNFSTTVNDDIYNEVYGYDLPNDSISLQKRLLLEKSCNNPAYYTLIQELLALQKKQSAVDEKIRTSNRFGSPIGKLCKGGNMNTNNIQKIINQGETTSVQFKERVNDTYKLAIEMVAFSNSQGGIIIVGVDDKTGKIKGLSYEEIQTTNALLANAASENVKPAIIIHAETVDVEGQNIVVATVSKGKDKPYKNNKGIIWVKNGSDKRKVFSNNELRVMM